MSSSHSCLGDLDLSSLKMDASVHVNLKTQDHIQPVIDESVKTVVCSNSQFGGLVEENTTPFKLPPNSEKSPSSKLAADPTTTLPSPRLNNSTKSSLSVVPSDLTFSEALKQCVRLSAIVLLVHCVVQVAVDAQPNNHLLCLQTCHFK